MDHNNFKIYKTFSPKDVEYDFDDQPGKIIVPRVTKIAGELICSRIVYENDHFEINLSGRTTISTNYFNVSHIPCRTNRGNIKLYFSIIKFINSYNYFSYDTHDFEKYYRSICHRPDYLLSNFYHYLAIKYSIISAAKPFLFDKGITLFGHDKNFLTKFSSKYFDSTITSIDPNSIEAFALNNTQ